MSDDDTPDDAPNDTHPFAPYVRTLGRGPGRSRALTRAEARRALALVLAGDALPEQVGAFMMLLRYRGESPDEIAGLVEAARTHAGLPLPGLNADLDWPSYADGRTRGLPWFLLAARLVAQAGLRVVVHGPLAGAGRTWFGPAVAALGLQPAADAAQAQGSLAQGGLAVLAIDAIAPGLTRLLELRGILGLRSPINTVARLLDPAAASAGFDGVFHPPYIALHLGVAERFGRPRLAVIKGAGGEAERTPAKPVALQGWDHASGAWSEDWPALLPGAPRASETPPSIEHFRAVWDGTADDPSAVATIVGSAAIALRVAGRAKDPADGDAMAAELWRGRSVP